MNINKVYKYNIMLVVSWIKIYLIYFIYMKKCDFVEFLGIYIYIENCKEMYVNYKY